MRSYAIGDSHGQLDYLRVVHRWIAEDRARVADDSAPVVHLGDYVDRGPDSRGVLDHLLAGLADGQPWILLKGNHDRMMSRFLQVPEQRDPRRPDLHWLEERIGGRATLASYGVDVSPARPVDEIHAEARARVPPEHVALLEGLQISYCRGGVFFCHAGIRPGLALGQQVEDDLIWIRGEFLDDGRDHGALIVHGHTPVEYVTHYGNRLNLDTGAAYGGPLSAVVIEGGEVFQLSARGRRPIHPMPGVF